MHLSAMYVAISMRVLRRMRATLMRNAWDRANREHDKDDKRALESVTQSHDRTQARQVISH
jgi:hypothetical protein